MGRKSDCIDMVFTSMFSKAEYDRVIKISRILSPTPVDDNYWRNLISKSLTNESFSVKEAFELGRFTERMFSKACDIMYEDRDKNGKCDDELWADYSATLGYKQYLQGKFHKK